jgi:hypothetical protein
MPMDALQCKNVSVIAYRLISAPFKRQKSVNEAKNIPDLVISLAYGHQLAGGKSDPKQAEG